MNRIIYVNEVKYEFICMTDKNYNGFKHIAKLYINGRFANRKERQYYNRTWEKYDYQSVMLDIIKEQIEILNSWYLEKFKTEKGYKRMTDKRKLEFSDYIALDSVYEKELKELQYVLDNLENESC
jgi:hypothetical protein